MDCQVNLTNNSNDGSRLLCPLFHTLTEVTGFHCVTTGLDPVVHADMQLGMDARVKPGHDERENDTLE
jgi:hypothetical protein